MPCNSDHMEASGKERELSRVACLLDELDGKAEIDSSHWRGYHPAVYNRGINEDALVSKLCSRLQEVDVSTKSLEMQMWWRDHQKADKQRIAAELSLAKDAEARALAISKLTQHEQRLLGLTD